MAEKNGSSSDVATIERGETMLTISQWHAVQSAEKQRELEHLAAIKAAKATKAAVKPARRMRAATVNDIGAYKSFSTYNPHTLREVRWNADKSYRIIGDTYILICRSAAHGTLTITATKDAFNAVDQNGKKYDVFAEVGGAIGQQS